MEESLSPEHSCELLAHTPEHLLDRSGVPDEGRCHLQTLWCNVTDAGFDVVWDPFNEVGLVLVLDVHHLLIDLFGAQLSTEHSGCGQVTSMTRVSSAHHVLGIPHLLGQFWDAQGTVLL